MGTDGIWNAGARSCASFADSRPGRPPRAVALAGKRIATEAGAVRVFQRGPAGHLPLGILGSWDVVLLSKRDLSTIPVERRLRILLKVDVCGHKCALSARTAKLLTHLVTAPAGVVNKRRDAPHTATRPVHPSAPGNRIHADAQQRRRIAVDGTTSSHLSASSGCGAPAGMLTRSVPRDSNWLRVTTPRAQIGTAGRDFHLGMVMPKHQKVASRAHEGRLRSSEVRDGCSCEPIAAAITNVASCAKVAKRGVGFTRANELQSLRLSLLPDPVPPGWIRAQWLLDHHHDLIDHRISIAALLFDRHRSDRECCERIGSEDGCDITRVVDLLDLVRAARQSDAWRLHARHEVSRRCIIWSSRARPVGENEFCCSAGCACLGSRSHSRASVASVSGACFGSCFRPGFCRETAAASCCTLRIVATTAGEGPE